MAEGAVAELFASLGLHVDEHQWNHGNKLITGMKAAIGVFAVALGFHELKETIEKTVSLGEHAVDTSRKLGITAEAIQELGFAAGQQGGSIQGVEDGMKKLAKTLEAARHGGKDQKKAFKELGVSMKDLDGETLDQNLEVVAERFKAMPDGAQKAALAIKIFGRAGADMIPLLDQGQAGIAALRNEAQKLGGVLSNEDAAATKEFADEQKRLSFAMSGLRNTLVMALLPGIQRVVGALSGWVAAHHEQVVSAIRTAVDALGVAFGIVGDVFDFAVVPIFNFFRDNTDVVIGLLVALGGAFAAMGVEAAIAWALALGPIELVALGVGAAIIVVSKFGGTVEKIGRKIGDVLGKVWKVIKSIASGAVNTFASIARVIMRPFIAINDAFNAAGRALKSAFVAVFDWIAERIRWVEDKIDGVIRFLRDPWAGIKGVVKGAVRAVEAVGGVSGPTAQLSTPVRAPGAGGGPGTVAMTVHNEFNIDAKNADASEVVAMAHDTFKQSLKRELQHATAATEVA